MAAICSWESASREWAGEKKKIWINAGSTSMKEHFDHATILIFLS